MAITTCPACTSSDLALYPVTKRTARVNFRCRVCGMVGWTERPTPDLDEHGDQSTVGLDLVSVEERSKWFDTKSIESGEDLWSRALDTVDGLVGDPAGRRWYDIGAGDGKFLAMARDHGYAVRGNDLFEAAPAIARQKYDVQIDLGDLRTYDLEPQDVVSLWCVIAHNADPVSLLRAAADVLRPGGVIFLQTPHRSAVDRAALRALRASRGRLSHWTDRRIAAHHWFLHSPASITKMLENAGFTDVHVEPVALYTRSSDEYLRSMGVSAGLAKGLGRAADSAVAHGLVPRITMTAYARRPGTLGPSPA
ncbi:MAG: class I SAM-dependent methyltransferase [Nocardioidaceae bacterium]|nr:class I SAM-dependent methyltransferase [Nocardioidaceae bacterium]MCL2614519.1 class I SAM-dependent methyltransferase [Nocardioidaceae bacterium]